ncbi:FliH/SctL family protein [Novosphingobium album (ex Liu et al. 2023)]|nr:FliH/SctL family protein [Novosphingobium album (ex Liu et al. 2023)]
MRLPFAALSEPGGFRADARFGLSLPARREPEPTPIPNFETAEPDLVSEAFAQGYAAGAEQARAEAEAVAAADAAAAGKLALSFSRLDKAMEDELRLRLRDTVAALCESAIMPLALDEDMLVRRIETAVSMLSRADDERVIRLHPDDFKLVSPRLCAEWDVQADATMPRGELRVDCTNGGVEDGPATWRRAIAEALHQC